MRIFVLLYTCFLGKHMHKLSFSHSCRLTCVNCSYCIFRSISRTFNQHIRLFLTCDLRLVHNMTLVIALRCGVLRCVKRFLQRLRNAVHKLFAYVPLASTSTELPRAPPLIWRHSRCFLIGQLQRKLRKNRTRVYPCGEMPAFV